MTPFIILCLDDGSRMAVNVTAIQAVWDDEPNGTTVLHCSAPVGVVVAGMTFDEVVELIAKAGGLSDPSPKARAPRPAGTVKE